MLIMNILMHNAYESKPVAYFLHLLHNSHHLLKIFILIEVTFFNLLVLSMLMRRMGRVLDFRR